LPAVISKFQLRSYSTTSAGSASQAASEAVVEAATTSASSTSSVEPASCAARYLRTAQCLRKKKSPHALTHAGASTAGSSSLKA